MTPSQVVDFLNDMLRTDPEAISALFNHREPCNSLMIDHPYVMAQLGRDNVARVGVLGLLNGMIGQENNRLNFAAAPGAPIQETPMIVLDRIDDRVVGFRLTHR